MPDVSRTVLKTVRVLGLTMQCSDSTRHLEYAEAPVSFLVFWDGTKHALHAPLESGATRSTTATLHVRPDSTRVGAECLDRLGE